MKSSIMRPVEAVLALAVLALLALLVIPWASPAPAALMEREPTALSPEALGSTGQPAIAPPELIDSLFTKRSAAQPSAAAAAPAAKTPVTVPWLSYTGSLVREDGTPVYLFKDSRSNRSIVLTRSEPMNGWTLVEAGTNRWVLKNGEELYLVTKR